MKISLDKQQIIIVSSIFLATFLLAFTVFGGFSKIGKISKAKDVQKQNIEYQKMKEEQAEELSLDSYDSMGIDETTESVELLSDEALQSDDDEGLSALDDTSLNVEDKEEVTTKIPLTEELEGDASTKEAVKEVSDSLSVENTEAVVEGVADIENLEKKESEKIEAETKEELKANEDLSDIDKAFLGTGESQ
jgi:hypothetical protein